MKSELGALRRDLAAERHRSASAPPTPAHPAASPIADGGPADAVAAAPDAAAPAAGSSGMGPLIPP
eukprot:4689417-Prymnesium_polylepis.1